MPRKNKKARKRDYARLTFKDACKIAGITPKQRLILIRNMKKRGEV
jgi:hypothetical protein